MCDSSLPKNKNEDDSDSEETNPQASRSLGLDLGDDCLHNVFTNRLGTQVPTESSTSDSSNLTSKKDDNPFSFKHFLRGDSDLNRNYQSLGARPKVYRENRQRHESPPESPKRVSQNQRKIKEFSSVLPDFVQDHLVIEQCYLGKTCPSPAYDLDLPDFTQADHSAKSRASGSSPDGDPPGPPIPLDLPGLPLRVGFPLDLPLSGAGGAREQSRPTPLAEVGNSKSLPDFLTDGPVGTGGDGTPHPPSALPSAGGDASRCCQCDDLHVELATARQRAARAEDEVEKCNRRSTVAENAVLKLKQDIKTLKAQISQLKSENQALRNGEGASGGGHPSWSPPEDLPSQRFAQELRTAASTAEHSLRQLLTGVDNLRMMASALENLNRIEEKPDRYSSFDDDAGPAL